MLICMAGLPFGGKSYFVTKFLEQTNLSTIVVDPNDWLEDVDNPNFLKDMTEEEQKSYRITAWEFALEHTIELLRKESDTTIIILDTAAAAVVTMSNLITEAKVQGHTTVYVYVSSPVSACKNRAKDDWIGDEAVKKYIEKFKQSIPELTKLSDKLIVVLNNGADLEEPLSELESFAGRSTSASGVSKPQ